MRSSFTSAIRGEATVPGDKSLSHRALMLGSQALGKTRISGLLEGEDVLRTASALRSLGVRVERKAEGAWEVIGVGAGGLHESASALDMGNAGTGARLLMGLLAPYPFATRFIGDASLSGRPMRRVMTPLEQMGARFEAREGKFLPLTLIGTSTPIPITYSLPVASAQVKSAILLAGLNTRGITTVIEKEPTRDHTENMLEYFGFAVERNGLEVSVAGHQNPPRRDRALEVPSDPSSAAFPVVAALITPESRLILKNVCINPLRTGLFTTLSEMGAKLEFKNRRRLGGEEVADIAAESSALRAVTVPASRAPSMIDEYPILAVAAAFAEGETVMEGLSELRVKESDRLAAIIEGLTACGVEARADGDTLYVKGGRPKGGATIVTKLDHRIAMSFLVMGMATPEPVAIDDAEPIATSFPGFAELMNRLGAHITDNGQRKTENALIIAIDGPAASGKGTLARRLAEHLGIHYLDTGRIYRAVALKLEGKNVADEAEALAAARAVTAADLNDPRLREEHVGRNASIVSAMPDVRAALLKFQRDFARSGAGAILDGRDIGTVVLPEARHKFYITASLEARARRRWQELASQGMNVSHDAILNDLRERDARDARRTIAPMKPAEDAIVIDTSALDAEHVFREVLKNLA